MRPYFNRRSRTKLRELHFLLRQVRVNLVIGLLFPAACLGLGEMALRAPLGTLTGFVELGLQIVGWVAMWRPLEIFLDDCGRSSPISAFWSGSSA